MTLLAVTRAAPIGAAQLGFLICLTFGVVFSLLVIVGELRRKSTGRAPAVEGPPGADAQKLPEPDQG